MTLRDRTSVSVPGTETCPDDAERLTMRQAIDRVGWTYRIVDDETFADVSCCGDLVDVWSGIAGTDRASCATCGKTILNLASPHINGGHFSERDDLWEARS